MKLFINPLNGVWSWRPCWAYAFIGAARAAFREVADSLAVQGTINEQVSAQQSLVNATEETYRLSNKRYENGVDNYLSVLVAQRSLYLQQQVLIGLHLTRLANEVKLYAVLGRGRRPARSTPWRIIEVSDEGSHRESLDRILSCGVLWLLRLRGG